MPQSDGHPTSGLTDRRFECVTFVGQRGGDRGCREQVMPVLQEVPVALAYNGIGHAVLMATPCDLQDFALGFSLSEGIVSHADEILDCGVSPSAEGVQVDLVITARRAAMLAERRRTMIGASGCGLCGVETLEAALRPLSPVKVRKTPVAASAIHRALAALSQHQMLNRETGAAHAAAWVAEDGTILGVREDVGRHNALDKLIGGNSRLRDHTGAGFLVMTSRCSYELVAKAITLGINLMVTISAPTSLALDCAARYGLCLAGVARADAMRVYTNPDWILSDRDEVGR